jgi:hypothetical protein
VTEEFPTELLIGGIPTETQLSFDLENGLFNDPERSWSELCGVCEIYIGGAPDFVQIDDAVLKFSPQSVEDFGEFTFKLMKIGSSSTTERYEEITIITTVDC